MARYSDLDYSFGLDADGDLLLVYDDAAIMASIKTIIETATGTRPGVGYEVFGCSLKKYLFSELSETVADNIRQELMTQLKTYEPRIVLDKIDMTVDVDNRAYLGELFFHPINDSTPKTYNFLLSLR
jgi:phage baseplate assembly protein W